MRTFLKDLVVSGLSTAENISAPHEMFVAKLATTTLELVDGMTT